MNSVETECQSGESAAAPREPTAHPVESIALAMKCLSEAADQMRLAVTEVLSLTVFCADVKRSLSALIGPDLHTPICAAEPVLDQLYQDAHHNLAAMRRAGRQTMAAINGVEQAASMLCQLGADLDTRHRQGAAAAGNDREAAFCAGRPECGCAPR